MGGGNMGGKNKRGDIEFGTNFTKRVAFGKYFTPKNAGIMSYFIN